ncbi:MAG TPA: PadR family transcriptional regulator [Ktedonobacteraceae bacterium]|nr:PadR family transcriptional regulator [Ktedonobacteraceae bacterium]
MDRSEAYPITYSVLGLLAFWGPLSGYDLKRLFDHMLSPMWGAAHSQIYHELRRMKDLGWVEMEREEQESRPDRKVYSITQSGRDALTSWQAKPASVLQLRDELLLKVMFGSFASRDDLIENLKKGIADHEMRLLNYRQNSQYIPARGEHIQEGRRRNPYTSESQEDPFMGLIVRFAIEFEKTYLSWLYETLTFLEENETL